MPITALQHKGYYRLFGFQSVEITHRISSVIRSFCKATDGILYIQLTAAHSILLQYFQYYL